jgi:hypothetical protein
LAAGDTERLLSVQMQKTKGSAANSRTVVVHSVPAATSCSTENRGNKVHCGLMLATSFTSASELVTQKTSGRNAFWWNIRSICCRRPNDGSVRTNGNSELAQGHDFAFCERMIRSKRYDHPVAENLLARNRVASRRRTYIESSIRRSCYNKAHDLKHGFHTPALLNGS